MTQPVEYYSMQQYEAIRPHLERQLPTYGTMNKSQLEAFDIYHREKLEAALTTLGRILQQDEIDELRFRIDEECEKQEKRLANLRQAGRAMEEWSAIHAKASLAAKAPAGKDENAQPRQVQGEPQTVVGTNRTGSLKAAPVAA